MNSVLPIFRGSEIEQKELNAYALVRSIPESQRAPDPLRRILEGKQYPHLLTRDGLFGQQVVYDMGPEQTMAMFNDGSRVVDDKHNFVSAEPWRRRPEAFLVRGKAGVEPQDPVYFSDPNRYSSGDKGFGPGWMDQRAAFLRWDDDPKQAAAYTRAKNAVGQKWCGKLNWLAVHQPDALSSITSVADLLERVPDAYNSTRLVQHKPVVGEKEEENYAHLKPMKRRQEVPPGYHAWIPLEKQTASPSVGESQQKKKSDKNVIGYLPFLSVALVAAYVVVNRSAP